jgi:vitamin B12 transporter
MTLIRTLLAVSPAALLAAPALAQTAGDPLEDGAIVVTANRTERAVEQVGQSVTVVTERQIASRQPTDVLDILRTVPGVRFNRNGGIGGTAGVSIRGAESDQTVVLVDGVKLNDPAAPGGGFDFGPLLTGNIGRVEVVRGPQSVLYGSQAIGGVANLITREPTRSPALFARAEYGGDDTAQLTANVAGRAGPVAASLGGTYLRSDGISAFSAARGGREADGFESVGANGKVTVTVTNAVALDLRGFYADSRSDVDGFSAPLYALADTPEVSDRTDFVGYAGVRANLLGGRFRNRFGFAYTDIDRRSVDPSSGAEVETFAAVGRNRRYEYQGVLQAGRGAELVFGMERDESSYRSVSFGGPPDRQSVWLNSLYGQVNLVPIKGLSLTGGVRLDDHQTFGSETTFAANGAWSPDDGATVLRASYGEGFKAPALFQLFSDYGNTALQPEVARSFDIGLTHAFLARRAQIAVTHFERRSRNLIAFVSCFASTDPICANRPFGTYDNVALAEADGWEFELALQPVTGFDLALNYSLVDAVDRMSGNRLARRPRDTVSLVADVAVTERLSLGATVLLAGDSFEDAANSQQLDGYALADVRASFAITPHLDLIGRIENAFDAQYETALLYGQPGRRVFGGIRYRM